MIVGKTKPGQLICVKNFFGVREFYLITEKQDNPIKRRAYKQLKGGFVYLDLHTECKVVTKDVVS
jgi:hypothetical protein